MKKLIVALILAVAVNAFGAAPSKNPRVTLETDMGNIVVELYPDKAPITVKNFTDYVESGFYGGTIFHRVIPGFMVQGGGLTEEMQPKATKAQIKNEADNGLKNERGTIAMARTGVVDSATCQFFINVVDNGFLNFKSATQQGYGYAVFGKVVDGMDVVDAIAVTKTGMVKGFKDVPLKPVRIKKATIK